ncbi:dihydroorotase [Flavisolibacter ginsenosidimutans]|uniref:Dihydroorotase n=1 Tax=Flavisolibacter ginsenosidimutans TaxID=661481 RepID=A0A5B8UDU6_9BACT|nr:dihydroorotase [Flavisolibacter ginsenosidimutans]QEC54847.1 dihydroorotase [Flavisolibacter ginsenosidimutans]
MDIVLKGVTVADPFSPFHLQTSDVFIQNGFIAEIGNLSRISEETIAVEGLHVSPGFADVFAHFCDPGQEQRETLETGALAAAYGGYTDVMVLPNTIPAMHHKAGVEYIVQRSRRLPVSVHPIGAVTKNAEGKELAEMYDMQDSGAVAFSDGLCPLQSSGIAVKALQYLKAVDKTLIQLPDDGSLSAHGLMNEGIASTRLGLPGKPAIAEELMIGRDLELAKYTGSKLHITGVSTAKGINLIKAAKKAGVSVTCSVTPYHLFFSDDDLNDYDTNLKVSPPLRTKTDCEALKAALLDGVIDCIASHHLPQHTDNKIVEFEYAKNGMIGLETCFAAVRTTVPQLSLERLVDLFSTAPRKIFALPQTSVQAGQLASLSLFLPNAEWMPSTFYSRSKNSAFTGKTLTGKPLGIIHKGGLLLRPQ